MTSYSGSEWRPDFSPRGERIAFEWEGPDQQTPNWDIYVKQIGIGNYLRLTSEPTRERFAKWSPNGQEIAFARWFPDHIAIFTVPSLGGVERTLGRIGRRERMTAVYKVCHGIQMGTTCW